MDEKKISVLRNTSAKFLEKVRLASEAVKVPGFRNIVVWGTFLNPIFDLSGLDIKVDFTTLQYGLHKFRLAAEPPIDGLTKLGINVALSRSVDPVAELLMVFINILMQIEQPKMLYNYDNDIYDYYVRAQQETCINNLHKKLFAHRYKPLYVIEDGRTTTIQEAPPAVYTEIWQVDRSIKIKNIYDALAREHPYSIPGIYASCADTIYSQLADYIATTDLKS